MSWFLSWPSKTVILRVFILKSTERQGVSQVLLDDVIRHFPNPCEFPIRSRFVLKATIHENKNSELFYVTWESFFSKRRFYDVVHACCIWLIFPFYHNLFLFFKFLYLSFINCFSPYHVTFYTNGSFSIFLRNFPFSSFPLIF